MFTKRLLLRSSALALLGASVCVAVSACERTEGWLRATRPPSTGGAGGSGTVTPPTGAGGSPVASAGAAGGAGAGGGGPTTTLTAYGPYQAVSRAEVATASAVCATTVFTSFAASAATLSEAAVSLAGAPEDAAARAAARQAFARALEAWSEAEMFVFGPAGGGPTTASATPGGRDLAPAIYGWPLVSRCEIDKATLSQAYAGPEFVSKSLIITRTLASADYLLFFPTADHGCGASGGVAAPWAQLGAGEINARRASYASVVTADASARGQALAQAWSPSGENFQGVLSTAGNGSTVFSTEQLALNAISDALFAVDQRVRDTKLSHPLGILDCSKPSCAEDFESQWAGISRELLLHNLIGFRRIVTGCGEGGAGIGFDDLLSSMGQPQAGDTLRQLVENAIRSCEGVVDPSFVVAVSKDRTGVERLRADVDAIVAFLKSDFLTLLDLELPKRLEGDND